MIRKSTRWDRKERVNVESDLDFNKHGGTSETASSIDIGNPSVLSNIFDTGSWAISTFIEFKDFSDNVNTILSKGDNIDGFWFFYRPDIEQIRIAIRLSGTSLLKISKKLELNVKYHFVLLKNGDDYSVYLNSIQIGAFSNTKVLLSTTTYKINNYIEGGESFGGLQTQSSHSIFNRALTQQEISYIHIQGGLVPESAHESCVAHYPLTQRQYFKASADFIIKHPQFVLNDLVALDEVEQYNYAKVTALTANHGELINFTDAEAGVDGLSKVGQSIKDFYKKDNLKIFGLDFIDIVGNRRIIVDTSASNVLTTNNTLAIFWEAYIYDTLPTVNEFVVIDNNNGGTARFDFRLSETSVYTFTLSHRPSIDVATWTVPVLKIKNKLINIAIIKNGDNTDNWILLINNEEMPNSESGNGNLLGTDLASYILGDIYCGHRNVSRQQKNIVSSRVAIYDGIPTDNELFDWGIKGISPSFLEEVNIKKLGLFSGGTTSIIGARPQTFPGFIDGEENERFVEKESLFPEIRKALDVNGGTVTITGNGTGIGLVIKTEAAIVNISDIVSGLSAFANRYVNGNWVNSNSDLISAINEQQLIHIHIECTVTNPIIQAFNGHVGLAYISNDNITLKDIYKNVNNLLVSNPSVNNQSKFNNYYIFNELVNINEIADLIGASNATTAATTFLDINELR